VCYYSAWRGIYGSNIPAPYFADRLSDHLKKKKDIPEIARSQRYANRHALDNNLTPPVAKPHTMC
jgi:hypothetical protein